MILVDLDQGAAGHPRRKPTTLATNLPGMGELHGLKGQGHQDGGGPTATVGADEDLVEMGPWDGGSDQEVPEGDD